MIPGNTVLTDLTAFRAQLVERRAPYQPLLRLCLWRPLRDIAWDWLVVLLAVTIVLNFSRWFAPLAIIVISNRQRALGNLLHDAGHRNLHRDHLVNDAIANLLLAPLLFASLAGYRSTHFKHHMQLGDVNRDPDYLAASEQELRWKANFARQLLSPKAWWGSLTGHLGTGAVPVRDRLYIVGWWSLAAWAMLSIAGMEFLVGFAVLWLLARATVFHAITTFREMCDHFGLPPRSVLSYTRDVVRHGVWYELVHPRNNGYHLTHHLLPAVPYYRLPEAQHLFSSMPIYQQHGQVFTSYIFGDAPVVAEWHTGARL